MGVSACGDGPAEAAAANGEAQAALARGDLEGARRALVRAVQARDDNAGYWTALGAVQLQLRAYPDAYYAYSRALELDRTNVQALRILAQIALLSDRVNEAEELADQLEILDADGAGADLVQGYVELKRGRPSEALKKAEEILKAAPSDEGGAILKALALENAGDSPSAIASLEAFLRGSPRSEPALQALLRIHKRRLDSGRVVDVLARLSELSPDNRSIALQHAQAAYWTGRLEEGRRASVSLVTTDAPPNMLVQVLKLWLTHETRQVALANAESVRTDTPSRRLSLARFLVEAGVPARAERLLRPDARLPVDGATATPVAVLAHALAAQGRRGEASALFDEVLAFDRNNLAALRGRADLHLSSGRHDAALIDVQSLVAENPQSPEDRMRLVRVYDAKGDRAMADRAIRRAFDDIPGSRVLYGALRKRLRRTAGEDELARLDERFTRQRRDAARE
jgi:tetratricopeptide (TPR) repeat protein